MEPKIINLMKLFTGEFLLLKLLMDPEFTKDFAALQRIEARGYKKTGVKFFTYETDDGKICFITYDLK